jgi:hypothetical protein
MTEEEFPTFIMILHDIFRISIVFSLKEKLFGTHIEEDGKIKFLKLHEYRETGVKKRF